MLAWAYFVGLWRSDWVRASQILVTLQNFIKAHIDAFVTAETPQTRAGFMAMQPTGQFDDAARAALIRALFLANVATSAVLARMPQPTAGVAALNAWAAQALIPTRDSTRPIWAAWNVASAVAPQDVAFHLARWADDFSEGVDTTPQHTTVAAESSDALSRATPTQEPAPSFFVPGALTARATQPLWPWVLGGLALVGLGGGLLYLRKRRRR
jgi:LPXTG-motif cell wall-anchored protein